jgi:hypothetical protein
MESVLLARIDESTSKHRPIAGISDCVACQLPWQDIGLGRWQYIVLNTVVVLQDMYLAIDTETIPFEGSFCSGGVVVGVPREDSF